LLLFADTRALYLFFFFLFGQTADLESLFQPELTNFAGQPAYYAGRTGAGRADAGVRGGSVTRALERGGSVTRALADVGRKVLGGTFGGGGGSRKQRLALGESNDFEFNVAQVPSSTEPGSRADGHNGPHGGMDEDEDEDNVARSMLFSSLGAEPSGIGADGDGQASDDGRRENSESESDDDEDVDGSAPVFSSAASLAANKRFAQVVEACQALPAAFGRAVLTEPAFGAALARRPLLAARLFVCWQLGHAQRATDLALMAGTQHLALAASAAAVAARAGIAVARSPIIVATCSKDALRLAKAAEAASERAPGVLLACVLLRMREREQYPGPLRAVRFLPRLARGPFCKPLPPPPPPPPLLAAPMPTPPSAPPVEEPTEAPAVKISVAKRRMCSM